MTLTAFREDLREAKGDRGGGAFHSGRAIRVSETAHEDADVLTGGVDWAYRTGYGERFEGLLRRARRHRDFGDFWGPMLIAQGLADVMIEFATLKLWDVAACNQVVVGAGGRATTIEGLHKVGPNPIVATNGALHDEVLRALGR